MPARLIFVESNTTGSGMLALTTADRLGLAPLLLTSDPGRYRGLAQTAAQVVECDTNNSTALAKTVAELPGELAGVSTTSEFYLLAVAELARCLGRSFNPPAAVRLCRDKAAQRRALAAAGVDQPRFVVLRDPRQVPKALAETGLPCVVKPADESGSQDVLLCRSAEQARAQVRRVLAAHTNARGQRSAGIALMEEYLGGPEYSVEMFSVAGSAHCVGITAKCVGGAPYFVETGHYYPAGLDSESAQRLASTARLTLAATGVREGPAHIEIKLSPDRAALIEINMRLAGGMIPELIRLATGIDLIEQQVRAAAGLPVDLRPIPGTPGHSGIRFLGVDRAGTLQDVTGTERANALPAIQQVRLEVEPGASVRPARNAYDRIGHVIAVGRTPGTVHTSLDEAIASIRLAVAPAAF